MIQSSKNELPTKPMLHVKKAEQEGALTGKMIQWGKPFLIFFFSLISLTKIYAQDIQSGIAGRVNMVDGQPLRAISVSLLEANRQTLTDDEGNYRFTNVNAGTYTIKLQILGSKEVRIPVEVKTGEMTTLDY